MDFLKKAKAGLKELEGDFNKATASLGLGEKKEDTTSNSTAQPTPSASNLLLLAPLLMPPRKSCHWRSESRVRRKGFASTDYENKKPSADHIS